MNHSNPPKRLIVIGGGPAGLTAAIVAAEAGCKVIVCEQLDRPGAKLLASGGGRCNLSNTLSAERFMAAFGRQGRFIGPALSELDASGLRQLLSRLGVPTVVSDNGLGIYPASQSALDVQKALWHRCRALGVEFRFKTRVTGLITSGDSGSVGPTAGDIARPVLIGVLTPQGQLPCQAAVLAAGGRGYSSLGGSDIGYALASQAGHQIIEPTPALVPLLAAQRWVGRCAGLALSDARVRIDLPGQPAAGQRGQVLFTHRGLSGPAILNISGDVAELLRRHDIVPLRIELAPESGPSYWPELLDRWRADSGARMARTLLGQHMPSRLAEALLQLAEIARDARVSQLARGQADRLAELLTGVPVAIRGTEGFEHAMVTRGGVSLKQVDPRTLASRLVEGLYFAGEVLDLAGPTGGFNLQWAFSSGHLAGQLRPR